MKKKATQIILLSVCLFLTGCGPSRMFLRKSQKELGLKPDEGVVILSFYIDGPTAFIPTTVVTQEINQYKAYGKKKVVPVQLSKYNTHGNMYLASLKLPEGTYTLAGFWGVLGGIWRSQFYIPCNKVFDVLPREINYAGRARVTMIPQGKSYQTSITINDFHEEDLLLFLSNYPILQGEKINKDLMY